MKKIYLITAIIFTLSSLVGLSLAYMLAGTDETAEVRLLRVEDGQITNDEGQEQGEFKLEQHGDVWRIFSSVELPEPREGESYRLWIKKGNTDEFRYGGELFKQGEGKYSVVYTTQEEMSGFDVFWVTLEDGGAVSRPGEVLLEWTSAE